MKTGRFWWSFFPNFSRSPDGPQSFSVPGRRLKQTFGSLSIAGITTHCLIFAIYLSIWQSIIRMFVACGYTIINCIPHKQTPNSNRAGDKQLLRFAQWVSAWPGCAAGCNGKAIMSSTRALALGIYSRLSAHQTSKCCCWSASSPWFWPISALNQNHTFNQPISHNIS